jgi:hypothetical protein
MLKTLHTLSENCDSVLASLEEEIQSIRSQASARTRNDNQWRAILESKLTQAEMAAAKVGSNVSVYGGALSRGGAKRGISQTQGPDASEGGDEMDVDEGTAGGSARKGSRFIKGRKV